MWKTILHSQLWDILEISRTTTLVVPVDKIWYDFVEKVLSSPDSSNMTVEKTSFRWPTYIFYCIIYHHILFHTPYFLTIVKYYMCVSSCVIVLIMKMLRILLWTTIYVHILSKLRGIDVMHLFWLKNITLESLQQKKTESAKKLMTFVYLFFLWILFYIIRPRNSVFYSREVEMVCHHYDRFSFLYGPW